MELASSKNEAETVDAADTRTNLWAAEPFQNQWVMSQWLHQVPMQLTAYCTQAAQNRRDVFL